MTIQERFLDLRISHRLWHMRKKEGGVSNVGTIPLTMIGVVVYHPSDSNPQYHPNTTERGTNHQQDNAQNFNYKGAIMVSQFKMECINDTLR